jgi:hypothetical protein
VLQVATGAKGAIALGLGAASFVHCARPAGAAMSDDEKKNLKGEIQGFKEEVAALKEDLAAVEKKLAPIVLRKSTKKLPIIEEPTTETEVAVTEEPSKDGGEP